MKALGIDLGTNSAAAAIIETNINPELDELGHRKPNLVKPLNHALRIFQEGVKIEKGVEGSRAAERTKYRSSRKLKFRRKLRKYETLKVLITAKAPMCPLEIDELEKWRNHIDAETGKVKTFKFYPKSKTFIDWLQCDRTQQISPYHIRNLALTQKIENPLLLGRAFYHLAQRRGFLSNRLDDSEASSIELYADTIFNSFLEAQNVSEIYEGIESIKTELPIDDDKDLKRLFGRISKYLSSAKNLEETKIYLTKLIEGKENLGKVKKGIVDLTEQIEQAGFQFLGQYLYHLEQLDRGEIPEEDLQHSKRLRNRYIGREEHYLKEFYEICRVQELDSDTQKALKRAIFYQRPLKSQKGKVAKCTLEPKKSRCQSSHPIFEQFRMLGFINSIKVISADKSRRALSDDEKKKIYPKFFRISKHTFEFSELAKVLGEELNFNFSMKYTVSGCPTIAVLMKVFGQDWKSDDWNSYDFTALFYNPIWMNAIKKTCIRDKDVEKSKEAIVNETWHVLSTFDSNEALETYAKNVFGLAPEIANYFSKIKLPAGYGNLSLKAMKLAMPYLIEGEVSSMALSFAKLSEIIKPEIWNNNEDKKSILNEIQDIKDNFRKHQQSITLINGIIKTARNESNVPLNLQELDSETVNKLEHNLADVWVDNGEEANQYLEQFKSTFKQGKFLKVTSLHESIIEFLITNDFALSDKSAHKIYDPRSLEQFKPPIKDKDTGIFILNKPLLTSIKNPMALRALYQVRALINSLIIDGKIDEYTVVHLEMSRALNDANKRKAIAEYQKEREKEREKNRERLIEHYEEVTGKSIEPNNDEILKYELWEEQKHTCPYSGNTLGIADVVGSSATTEIEHTIPRSISFDNSRANKTIALKSENSKKGNKIPFELDKAEDILDRIEGWGWKKNVQSLYTEIEELKRKTSAPGIDKEKKDKLIQTKHLKQIRLDYWRKKYNSFKIEKAPDGFKNSQIVDTGIITKYARAYLKTYFKKVHCYKGTVTAQFRKLWGMEEKSRDSHDHHLKDAFVLACINPNLYSRFSHYYRLKDQGNNKEANRIAKDSIPWKGFHKDMEKLKDNTLASHYSANRMGSNTVKILRKRGKAQTNSKGGFIYQKGDTARGRLHKETFYGAVYPPGMGTETVHYAIRKSLKDISASEVERIIDPIVKEKIKRAIDKKDLILSSTKENSITKTIWMNESKKVPIYKVRILSTDVKNPLKIKEHRDHKEGGKATHKHYLMAVNDENYMLVIYEGINPKGKVIRDIELINNLEAVQYFKESNAQKTDQPLYPFNKEKSSVLLYPKYKLIKGAMVIVKKNADEDIWQLSDSIINNRLYKVVGIEGDGRVQLRFHMEARMDKDLKKSSTMDFIDSPEKLRLSYNKLNLAIEGVDFNLTPSGTLVKASKDV